VTVYEKTAHNSFPSMTQNIKWVQIRKYYSKNMFYLTLY